MQRNEFAKDCNGGMNSVGIADQLQLFYFSFSKFLRNRKWWWAIFLWLHRMVCTGAYKCHDAAEERGGGKPLPHRHSLELLCELQCCPLAAEETSVQKKLLYLTPALMQREPWQHCSIHHIADTEGRMRCAWCRFKFKVHGGKYTDSKKLWSLYCSDCEAPETEDHKAKLRCTNCTFSPCSVACHREFHQLGKVVVDE